MNKNNISGLFLIDKSPGFTSHFIVAHVRKVLKQALGAEIKVGHLGTLDPFASGLLPILIGGATRLSDDIISNKKQYLFQIKLGSETDTLDCAGQVIKTAPVPENAHEKIEAILTQFIGDIEQVPPVYSALKMQGRPLYEYMRAQGKLPQDIETKKRKINIEKIELLEKNSQEETLVTLRVLCGKGTYIRSLSRDIALAIGTVGHCVSLRREYVEPWHVDNAILFTEETRTTWEDIEKNLIPSHELLPQIPVVDLPQSFYKLFSSGNIVSVSALDIGEENFAALRKNEQCFARLDDKSLMYLARLEFFENGTCKIRPNKKIV